MTFLSALKDTARTILYRHLDTFTLGRARSDQLLASLEAQPNVGLLVLTFEVTGQIWGQINQLLNLVSLSGASL